MSFSSSSSGMASMIQPRKNISTNNINILISLPKQQGMHHPFINLDRLILTLGLFIQCSAHIRISHNICASMQHNERKTHIAQSLTHVLRHFEQLHYRPQSRLSSVPHRIHIRYDLLLLHLHRLVHEVRGGHNGQAGKESGHERQNLRNWPPGFHLIRNFTHGCHQNRTLKSFRLREVDQKANGAAHGLAVEKTGDV